MMDNQLKHRLEAMTKVADEFQMRYSHSDQSRQHFQRLADQHKNRIAELEKQLAERDLTIATVETDYLNCKTTLHELHKQLANRDATIAAFEMYIKDVYIEGHNDGHREYPETPEIDWRNSEANAKGHDMSATSAAILDVLKIVDEAQEIMLYSNTKVPDEKSWTLAFFKRLFEANMKLNAARKGGAE